MEHSHETRELYLFALNDAQLYQQQRESIEKTSKKRFDAGTYNRVKAVQLWTYFANNAAKKYHKEFVATANGIACLASRIVSTWRYCARKNTLNLCS